MCVCIQFPRRYIYLCIWIDMLLYIDPRPPPVPSVSSHPEIEKAAATQVYKCVYMDRYTSIYRCESSPPSDQFLLRVCACPLC